MWWTRSATASTGSRSASRSRSTPTSICGTCDYCLSGRLILCANAKGLGSNYPGFFAEYVTVPANLVFSVAGLAARHGGVHRARGLRDARARDARTCGPGSSALVFGAGPTGLLLAQLIASGGASSVTVAAPTQFKLDRAAALGVDQDGAHRSQTTRQGNLRRSWTPPAATATTSSSRRPGSTEIGDICVPLTRNGGTVMIYGVTRGDEVVTFHPFDVFRREITIKGSFAEMTSFGAAIAALRGGRVRTDGIITHRFSLDQYGKALDALANDRTAHKIVLVA